MIINHLFIFTYDILILFYGEKMKIFIICSKAFYSEVKDIKFSYCKDINILLKIFDIGLNKPKIKIIIINVSNILKFFYRSFRSKKSIIK